MTDVPMAGERFAAIDVGSNSIRLLVAEWNPETGLEVIDELRDQPRLATGLSRTGALAPVAMEAAMVSLARMMDVANRRGAKQLAAVATSAIRDASNGQAFAGRVRRELGIPLEVIDADREARLSWRSVRHHFQLEDSNTIVADIGGGSLELIGAVEGLVEITTSLPLGAVRLTEKIVKRPGRVRHDVAAMRKHARRTLKKALPWREWRKATLIGSGGSFTNLARIASARRGHATDPIHGTKIRTGEVEGLLEWLTGMDSEQRSRVPGLNPMRADIILAGIAVTAELMDLLDVREVTASGYGLREGLLLELVGAETGPQETTDPLTPLREFVDRCRGDRRHVEQVRLLALALHEQLGHVIGCGEEERWLLEAAALLHDVGQLVSYRKHHRHSYQLIMNAERLGLGVRDRTLVALISRYHRKRGPSMNHEEFVALDPADREIVRRLSGLLRVADGLDRGHTAAVDRLRVTRDDQACTISVYPRHGAVDLSLEVWGAEKKRGVLEKVLGSKVRIEVGNPDTQAP